MKRLLRSPLATALLLVVAVGLIGFGGINAILAVPRFESLTYGAQIELSSISTALVEKNNVTGAEVVIPDGDVLLTGLFDSKKEQFQVGKTYDEVLMAANDGAIDEYVRVTVYKYWVDKDGNQIKDTALDPALIELTFVEGNGWAIDADASTEERTVLYYGSTIAPGETTTPFTKTLTISDKTLTAMATGAYAYEGATFRVEAVVDAVQTHNGTQAMTGAWGRTN